MNNPGAAAAADAVEAVSTATVRATRRGGRCCFPHHLRVWRCRRIAWSSGKQTSRAISLNATKSASQRCATPCYIRAHDTAVLSPGLQVRETSYELYA